MLDNRTNVWEISWGRNCENSYIFTFKNKEAADKLIHILNELAPTKGPTEIPLTAFAEAAKLKTNRANDELIYFYKCSPDGISFAICSKSKSHPTPMTIRLIAEAICGKDTFSMTYWTENKDTGVCASDDPLVIDHHWVVNTEWPPKDGSPVTDKELVEWLHSQSDVNADWATSPKEMIYVVDYYNEFDRTQFLYYHYVEADMWGR